MSIPTPEELSELRARLAHLEKANSEDEILLDVGLETQTGARGRDSADLREIIAERHLECLRLRQVITSVEEQFPWLQEEGKERQAGDPLMDRLLEEIRQKRYMPRAPEGGRAPEVPFWVVAADVLQRNADSLEMDDWLALEIVGFWAIRRAAQEDGGISVPSTSSGPIVDMETAERIVEGDAEYPPEHFDSEERERLAFLGFMTVAAEHFVAAEEEFGA